MRIFTPEAAEDVSLGQSINLILIQSNVLYLTGQIDIKFSIYVKGYFPLF